MDYNQLLAAVKALAYKAGDAIMDIYGSGTIEAAYKEENGFISPLTQADTVANEIIVSGLEELSDDPIISEEGRHDAGGSKAFWLVDPIDGTKEFLKHNDEFTVNIGLIQDGVPILGVVYAPAKHSMYYGAAGFGAYKQADGEKPLKIVAAHTDEPPTVIVSRSHANAEATAFLKRIGTYKEIYMGSSLKLCLVAEGAALVYPRFTPTSLWDTAAADAIVRAAGGSVTDVDGKSLVYDPVKDIRNPYFIVYGRQKLSERAAK